MEILACVKRVPMVGGKVVVTADGQDVDTRMSGFTVSPHEECAVEEAVQLTEREGGTVTVLTLGPAQAAGQLRDMLALGARRAVLLQTDGREWGPMATADAIAADVSGRAAVGEPPFDLLLFGNEAADTGGYQVAIRVAHLLGLPVATGIKQLTRTASGIQAGREYRGTQETYELPLPAVVTVKEGINLPRYPSLPGRLRAKRAAIDIREPQWQEDRLRKGGLRVPQQSRKRAQILGSGVEAVPALVALLQELGVLS
ncbi:MAG TPA: electron transfer flavoprotein subunit beta/FixA family protein [Streptosporangiaceae bacterium]|jgi:electron transfer flavoprotein beta subunit